MDINQAITILTNTINLSLKKGVIENINDAGIIAQALMVIKAMAEVNKPEN